MFTNLLTVMLRLISMLILGSLSSGHPINLVIDLGAGQSLSETPKWHNHCKVLPESSHHLSKQFSQTKSLSIIKDLFQKVEKSALISLRRAEDVKSKFVQLENIFDDFEGLKIEPHFDWLPTISPASEEFFKDMNERIALETAHEYIQKFAVALEQIVTDQNNKDLNDAYNEALHSLHFKNIDDDNYSVLCEIRMAMSVVFGPVNNHFTIDIKRTVMPEEDRTIGEVSKRMLRDYLILRQYVKTIHFITKLFEHFRQKL